MKMGKLSFVWILVVGTSAAASDKQELSRFQFTRTEMAVPITITLYWSNSETATRASDAAFTKIRCLNAILSDYDPQSELRRLGDTAHQEGGVHVSPDLWRVLSHAQALAERSDGAFDVTVGPVVRLWRRARRRGRLPPPELLDSARSLVGYRLIRLNSEDCTVELLKTGMRLDLGGIAKGYAVDEALKVLREFGIKRAIIDAGGDIVLGDPPPGMPGWRVGMARLTRISHQPGTSQGSVPLLRRSSAGGNPKHCLPLRQAVAHGGEKCGIKADGPPSRVISLSNRAVATSGDTWQHVEIDGRRYSHIVDPRTALGLTDYSSVTVVARDGITADGLASAVSVLGPEEGVKLIEATPSAAAFIVRAPQGKVETYRSSRWKFCQP